LVNNLGVKLASYTLGFIAVALVPILVMFYVFAEKLRGMSRYNPEKRAEGEEEERSEGACLIVDLQLAFLASTGQLSLGT